MDSYGNGISVKIYLFQSDICQHVCWQIYSLIGDGGKYCWAVNCNSCSRLVKNDF